MANDNAERGGSAKSPEKTLESVQYQLDSAKTRLVPFTGSTETATPLVNYPVAKLTYPECLEEYEDLNQVMRNV